MSTRYRSVDASIMIVQASERGDQSKVLNRDDGYEPHQRTAWHNNLKCAIVAHVSELHPMPVYLCL